jgi:hypothetical protein
MFSKAMHAPNLNCGLIWHKLASKGLGGGVGGGGAKVELKSALNKIYRVMDIELSFFPRQKEKKLAGPAMPTVHLNSKSLVLLSVYVNHECY